MKKIVLSLLSLLLYTTNVSSQSIDDSFSQDKMRKDLQVFKEIRESANSGLYKYRTQEEIDSIYEWAYKEIDQSSTMADFYKIICQLTDFEGSLHNNTQLPEKYLKSLRKESQGYFPYPIKYIEGNWIINYDQGAIPLGAKIIAINQIKMEDIIKNLYKFYTTDGVNSSGKRIGIEASFSKYFRQHYEQSNQFLVAYKERNSDEKKFITLNSVSYKSYYKNVNNRYSKPFDHVNYKDWKENEVYHYKTLNKDTGVLTVNDFALGDEEEPSHLRYVSFLDSAFADIKKNKIKNLIVDIRYNGGGDDPNDLVTYSYLTQRNFQENVQAWISFKKIPYLKYIYTKIPRFLRPLGVGKYNKEFQAEFPKEIDGKFYQDATSNDHKIRSPKENAFTGKIYLLISPRVASAGSMFAAMVAGNENTTVIGEETMGGYYGHNGHTPLGYILPKSKIETFFSVVNLEQDVPKKPNQIYNRGIIPDIEVTQSFEDYLNQKDTQMEFVIDLIKNKK